VNKDEYIVSDELYRRKSATNSPRQHVQRKTESCSEHTNRKRLNLAVINVLCILIRSSFPSLM